MTALIIGIVLVVGGVAFAAAPFLGRDRDDAPTPSPGRAPEPAAGHAPQAAAGRASVAGAAGDAAALGITPVIATELEELELDLAMGKLSDADYTKLRSAVEKRAALAPRDVAAPQASVAAEGGLRETRAPVVDAPTTDAHPADAGESASPDLDALAERLVQEERRRTVSCTTCGPRPEPAARFCSHCGMSIGGCPSCGREIRASGARFCEHCGTALTAR